MEISYLVYSNTYLFTKLTTFQAHFRCIQVRNEVKRIVSVQALTVINDVIMVHDIHLEGPDQMMVPDQQTLCNSTRSMNGCHEISTSNVCFKCVLIITQI